MLSEVLVRRFSRHHSRLLAYLDALEELIRDIAGSEEPAEVFRSSEAFLKEFSQFMETQDVQHMREEERLLRPALNAQMEAQGSAFPARTLARICQEHKVGHGLVRDFNRLLAGLDRTYPADPGEYCSLATVALDLVWHYRRHIWVENSIILPAAETLTFGDAAEAWKLE